jgi:hypothetical protein
MQKMLVARIRVPAAPMKYPVVLTIKCCFVSWGRMRLDVCGPRQVMISCRAHCIVTADTPSPPAPPPWWSTRV